MSKTKLYTQGMNLDKIRFISIAHLRNGDVISLVQAETTKEIMPIDESYQELISIGDAQDKFQIKIVPKSIYDNLKKLIVN
ncbi:MAG: hypothetical protein PF569_02995 [Candidatus Woesearchaeota archaeon]|jgi:hypothetical protein|nr:hypothetical protein [Candidatus Woesearchaeota archaeon]